MYTSSRWVISAIVAATAATSMLSAVPAEAEIVPRCGYTDDEPVLRYGSRGQAVRQAQCMYNVATAGPNITVDGKYGPATTRAVRRFQSCTNIDVDGIVGPKTWDKLEFWASPPYADACWND